MIDTDALAADATEHRKHIEALVHRTTEQAKDINELRAAIDELEQEIAESNEGIPSEQAET